MEYTFTHDDAQSLFTSTAPTSSSSRRRAAVRRPTAMYLALQHGLRVANHPLTSDDRPGVLPGGGRTLPRPVVRALPHHTAWPEYGASVARVAATPVARCRTELRDAETLYRDNGIPFINSHAMSVEKMASVILTTMKLRHR